MYKFLKSANFGQKLLLFVSRVSNDLTNVLDFSQLLFHESVFDYAYCINQHKTPSLENGFKRLYVLVKKFRFQVFDKVGQK